MAASLPPEGWLDRVPSLNPFRLYRRPVVWLTPSVTRRKKRWAEGFVTTTTLAVLRPEGASSTGQGLPVLAKWARFRLSLELLGDGCSQVTDRPDFNGCHKVNGGMASDRVGRAMVARRRPLWGSRVTLFRLKCFVMDYVGHRAQESDRRHLGSGSPRLPSGLPIRPAPGRFLPLGAAD